jgi:hypothetical protein
MRYILKHFLANGATWEATYTNQRLTIPQTWLFKARDKVAWELMFELSAHLEVQAW